MRARRRLVARYTELKRRMTTEVRRARGAAGAVAAVRAAGLRVGVLTNGLTDLQRGKLGGIGARRRRRRVRHRRRTSARSSRRPRRSRRWPTGSASAPHEAAMIGDNPVNDIAGALGAGWAAAVLVAVDPPPRRPAAAGRGGRLGGRGRRGPLGLAGAARPSGASRPRASIATYLAMRRARVSGRLASCTR